MPSLYPYQAPHASRVCSAIQRYGVFLDTSDTGTGKTFVALDVALRAGLRPHVICPKSVIPAWRDAMVLFGFSPDVINYEQAVRGKLPGFSSDGRTFRFPQGDRTLMIFDEAHRCKGEKTKNAELLLSAARTHCRVLMLSATPIETPSDMRAMGVTLGLFRDREFFRWKIIHGYRRLWHGHFGYTPDKLPATMERIRAAIGERAGGMKIRECPGFPENSVSTVLCALSGTLPAATADRVKALVLDAQEAESAVVELLRFRQAVELCKAEFLAERTASIVAEGRSVVCFLCFRESIDLYLSTLAKLAPNIPAARLDGETSLSLRAEQINGFNHDTIHAFAVQIAAGGTGISLHDTRGVRPRHSLISPGYSARELIQALGRIHRAGGRTPSVQEIVLADHFTEKGVKRALDGKLSRLETITDGDLMVLEN